MKHSITTALFVSLLVSCWAHTAWTQLLIDDFSTGKVKINIKAGDRIRTQAGTMLGGERFTHFGIGPAAANPFSQFGTFEIKAGGPLIVSSDYKVFHRLEVEYGEGAFLNLDLLAPTACGASPCGRFRIYFDGNSRVLNFNIVVFSADRTTYSSLGYNVAESGAPFTVDFAFDDFVANPGASFSDVDVIALVFQSGSAIGANDFAMTKVEAAP